MWLSIPVPAHLSKQSTRILNILKMFRLKNQNINNLKKESNYRRLLAYAYVLILVFLVLAPGRIVMAADALDRAAIATPLYFILSVVIDSMSGLAGVLDRIFSIGINDSSGNPLQVVQTTWSLVRNFSNMFFIVGLVIMAFATIFDVSKYNFRTMIVRFLIAALLVNFSLVIGTTIIDWTQSLSGVFLTAMGSYGNFLGGALSPEQLLGEPSTIAGNLRPLFAKMGGSIGAIGVLGTLAFDQITWLQVGAMFFSIILGSVIVFSLLIAVIFSAIRIPILWGLLILAPAAWVLSIFPPLANANRNWWKHFLGWNFFLPIYLFFLYVGLLFLQAQQQIITSTGIDNTPIPGLGFPIQTIFFYGFVAVFMISGVKFSMHNGLAAGAGVAAGAIWAKGQATARYAGSAPWRMSGAADVYKETKQKFKEQGFAGFEATEKNLGKLYRGQRGRDEAAAWLGEKTGLAPGMAEKQMARNIDLEKAKLKERKVGEAELRTMIADEKDPAQKIAAMQRLQEEFNKFPEADQVLELVRSLGPSVKTELGAKTLKQIKWSDMATEGLNTLLADPAMSDPNIQTLIYNALIEKRRVRPDQFNVAIDRSSLSGSQRANSIAKARELISEDMSSGERNALFETLMGLQKDSTGAFRHSAAEQARLKSENKDAIREILKIRAQKKDSFFDNETTGNPEDQAILNNYVATYFDSTSEKKKFLEDVSRKYAYSAAMTLLDQGLVKDDSGNTIARAGYTNPLTGSIMTSDEAEKLITKQTFQKLNLEEKLTQSKAQLAKPILSEVASEEMSRNSASMQNFVSHDKYQIFNVNTGGEIEKKARRVIFHREFLGPFMDQVSKLKSEIAKIQANQSATPPALTPSQLLSKKKALQDTYLARLRSLRGEYERMCTRYNMVDSTVTAQFNGMDKRIKRLEDEVIKLK
ncbi:MAG: hypothetical protein HYT62_02720 [Candidatus Yanofskybacteria bacterium]|nr:hypothetical protein [Candidatus Yanofskybacteria bacterium]